MPAAPSTTDRTRTRTELLAALDAAYHAMAALDCRLAAAGMRSWLSPRQHAMNGFSELHHLRDALRNISALPRVAATVAAAPQAPGPGSEIAGPSWAPTETGDDDRGPSVVTDLAQGDSTATAQPRQARSTEADPHHSDAKVARTGAYTKPQGHERIVVHLDVQMRMDAKSAATHEQGSASAGDGPMSVTTR